VGKVIDDSVIRCADRQGRLDRDDFAYLYWLRFGYFIDGDSGSGSFPSMMPEDREPCTNARGGGLATRGLRQFVRSSGSARRVDLTTGLHVG